MGADASLAALRSRHPWPAERPDLRSVDWCLDGGGRHLVTELITRRHVTSMLEIGAFFGGSVRTWLDHAPDLVVIAVDGWARTVWADYARKRGASELAAQLEAPDGFYESFLATNWAYRDRILPLRGISPAVLHELAGAGARPELIYLDSNKVGDELSLCRLLFPDAIVCGDDWAWGTDRWRDLDAGYPIRGPVRRFVAEHQLHLRTHRQTWVADPDPPTRRDRVRQHLVDLRMSWRRVRALARAARDGLVHRTARGVAGPE